LIDAVMAGPFSHLEQAVVDWNEASSGGRRVGWRPWLAAKLVAQEQLA